MRGFHWSTGDSPHKGPVTRKVFPWHDVIMKCSDRAFAFSFQTMLSRLPQWQHLSSYGVIEKSSIHGVNYTTWILSCIFFFWSALEIKNFFAGWAINFASYDTTFTCMKDVLRHSAFFTPILCDWYMHIFCIFRNKQICNHFLGANFLLWERPTKRSGRSRGPHTETWHTKLNRRNS